MNKKILPILIAAGMLVLSGCGGGASFESLEITNKAEMQAAWVAGSGSRTLELETEPAINIQKALADGDLVVESSAPTVASTVGLAVYALAEGTATITVSYLEEEYDTVDVTIEAAPDLDLTVTEALAIIATLNGATNETTALTYTVTGVVTAITSAYDSGYGNISFKIGETKDAPANAQITVYRLGVTAAEAATILPEATVVVEGKLQLYGSTPEIPQGGSKLISATGGVQPPAEAEVVTIAQALEIAGALAHNETTTELYRVSGVITAITAAYDAGYKNVSFLIGETVDAATTLLIYRLSIQTQAEADEKIVVGNSVVLEGNLKKYNADLELVSVSLISFTPGEGGGEIQPEFAADLTLDFSTDYSISLDKVTVNTSYTIGGINYGLIGGKAGKNYETKEFEYLMLYYENNGAFWNETAMTSAINRIRITSGSGASATAVYSLTVGTAAMVASQPQASATEAFVIGTGASHIFDCSGVAGATFFNISAFTKNCQVAKLEIEFVAA